MNTIYILGGDNDTLDEISKKSGKRLVWNKEKGSYDTEPVISIDRLSKMSLGEVAVFRQRRNPAITRLTAYNRYNFYKSISKLIGTPSNKNLLRDIELFSFNTKPNSTKHGNLDKRKEKIIEPEIDHNGSKSGREELA